MSAPKRWLDDADTTEIERDLLQSGASMEPPPGAQGDVWAALLTRIPPPGGPPPAQGSGAASKAAATGGKAAAAAKGAGVAASAGILKSALIGAGSAVALIATYSAVTPSPKPEAPPAPIVVTPAADPPSPSAAPAPPRAAMPEPAAAPSSTPSADPVIERRAAVEPRAAGAEAKSAAGAGDPATAATERETMLREESRLVGEARDALRRGDAPGALSMLEQIRAKFPAGVLAQEREALAIEALARSGRKADAAARADAFVKAYPTSPLAARVQQLTQ